MICFYVKFYSGWLPRMEKLSWYAVCIWHLNWWSFGVNFSVIDARLFCKVIFIRDGHIERISCLDNVINFDLWILVKQEFKTSCIQRNLELSSFHRAYHISFLLNNAREREDISMVLNRVQTGTQKWQELERESTCEIAAWLPSKVWPYLFSGSLMECSSSAMLLYLFKRPLQVWNVSDIVDRSWESGS